MIRADPKLKLRIVVIEPKPTEKARCGAVLVSYDDILLASVVLVHVPKSGETLLYPGDEQGPDAEDWVLNAAVEQIDALRVRLERGP